jgi:alpha-glucoside transport system permease protein
VTEEDKTQTAPPSPGGTGPAGRFERHGEGTGRLSKVIRFLNRAPATLLVLIIGAIWLVPTIGLLVSSFRSASDDNTTGWWNAIAHPSQLTVEPYTSLFSGGGMLTAFKNTVLITVPATLILVVVASLAAYAFAWIRFRGRDAVFLVVIGLLVVPIQVALIPLATLYGRVGLFGHIPGVILFHVAFGLPFAIFLLRNFFIGIPADLLEAARMDGAGELQVFYRVVMPLGTPAIASLAIFQFLWVWNDLLVGLVFASTASAPLTVFIRNQLREFASNINVIAPAAFIQMIVPLIVFFAFQRYFVQGLLAGSVK